MYKILINCMISTRVSYLIINRGCRQYCRNVYDRVLVFLLTKYKLVFWNIFSLSSIAAVFPKQLFFQPIFLQNIVLCVYGIRVCMIHPVSFTDCQLFIFNLVCFDQFKITSLSQILKLSSARWSKAFICFL